MTREPLSAAAKKVAALVAPLSGVVSALVAYGALTAVQADAVNGALSSISPTIVAVGTVIAGLAPIVASLAAAFGTASAARPDVTPTADPRDDDGVRLTPEVRL